jgi:hypothetical protein
MTPRAWSRIVGFGASTLAVVGFFTVADDWRHTGELLGVGSLLLAGLALAAAGWESRLSRRLALPWFAAAIAAGALTGAAIDNMPAGVGAGAALGVALAIVFGRRSEVIDATEDR